MRVKSLEIMGFKSFARKSVFSFSAQVSAIVGPNGSGKSNVAEALRFVLGEQSLKSMRGKRTEDLIFNGSKSIERQNRARVTIVFDNRDRAFPSLGFDEVSIAREIRRDVSSEYFLNDSPVRLKDIIEILASVHIGASGHHIISQGEADRILNASPRDRKEMIEDALGLKIYHWKISESEKKLIKTEENMCQSESLRREIAPHIKFLKKQVEKVEQARSLRDEVQGLYLEYLKREEIYLSHTRTGLHTEKINLEKELRETNEVIAKAEMLRGHNNNQSPESMALLEAREELGKERLTRDDLGRKIGRLEGMIEVGERRLHKPVGVEGDRMIPARESENLAEGLYEELGYAESSEDYLYIKGVISKTRARVGQFLEHIRSGITTTSSNSDTVKELEGLKEERDVFINTQRETEGTIRNFEERAHKLEQALEDKRAETTDAERALFESRSKKQNISMRLAMNHDRAEHFAREDTAFREEIREGSIIVGRAIQEYPGFVLDEKSALAENRSEQETRRKKIERIKMRLEDIMGGSSGEDVMREYNETVERDEFLAKELDDLKASAESLRSLSRELEETLNIQFKEGILKINKQFNEFFGLMFGGGAASLQVSVNKKKKARALDIDIEVAPDETEEEEEEGIEVAVNLPHKKIRGLQMLSGGERALTSIALLFAMSQVNPPPFLVLDETDAALDEANSRKYGDMIENLAKYSQLIVITHNRETMSRAGIICGVTMGADAISKLLSINFEEAVQLAK